MRSFILNSELLICNVNIRVQEFYFCMFSFPKNNWFFFCLFRWYFCNILIDCEGRRNFALNVNDSHFEGLWFALRVMNCWPLLSWLLQIALVKFLFTWTEVLLAFIVFYFLLLIVLVSSFILFYKLSWVRFGRININFDPLFLWNRRQVRIATEMAYETSVHRISFWSLLYLLRSQSFKFFIHALDCRRRH